MRLGGRTFRSKNHGPGNGTLPVRVTSDDADLAVQHGRKIYNVGVRYTMNSRKRLVAMFAITLLLSSTFHTLTSIQQAQRPNFRILSRRKIRKALRLISDNPKRYGAKQFSLLLRGDRLDLLQRSLDRHAGCKIVDDVLVDWTDHEDYKVPVSLLSHRSGKVRTYSERGKKNLDTGPLLLLQGGIYFTCADLEKGFYEWQKSPDRIVGLLPPCNGCQHALVSDKAAFVHGSLLSARPRLSKDDVCQHLALSAQLAILSGKEPIVVLTKPQREFSADRYTGIREKACAQQLGQKFGRKLLLSRMKLFVGSPT